MEKRINKKIDSWRCQFKNDIRSQIQERFKNVDGMKDLLEFVNEYTSLIITKDDLAKRKRVKNIVPLCDQCCALRANLEQCTRRRKDTEKFCGTHIKGTPNGEIKDNPPKKTHKKIQVWIQEIHGISYYIDKDNNIYDHHDILHNNTNPKIIARYTIVNGVYNIPTLFNKNK
ncbi:MAG: hypothetical protein CXT73_06595 [Methanobacteriota archaeon]|nr:MAG: hypothetical protein CXT73_06595 [Euryarchaeota archaeon]